MSHVHTRYVTWVSRGRRHHGSGPLDLVEPLDTAVTDGGSYQAWAPPLITYDDAQGTSQSGRFAFWSVVGASGGAFVSTLPALSVPVAGVPVQATAWYLPMGGGGPGEPGTFVDAFDVNQGSFVDDDFVSVSPDGALSAAANEDGWVPATAEEHVLAFGSIHGTPLKDWQIIYQQPAHADSASGNDLHTAAGSSAVAFAFFQRPEGGWRWDLPPIAAGTWVSWGVMVDGGGPTGNGPVDPWGPLWREFGHTMALAEAGRSGGLESRAAVLTLAARQLQLTSGKMARLLRTEATQKIGQKADLASASKRRR